MYNKNPKSTNLDSPTPFGAYIGRRGRRGLLSPCDDFKSRRSLLTSTLIRQDPVRRRSIWRSEHKPWGNKWRHVEVDGDSEDRPRLDERPDPLDEPLLEPREKLPL